EPPGKAFFAFLGGLACDLEGVGAGARQFPKFKNYILDINHTSLHFTIVKALIKDFLLNVRGI
ncbi:hypothetical protein, partial [Cytobacillus firmus]|uniref:hypothetical protein n=1 Tax=Cytobacillus firmus TaxID=1399 RepID=UPI0030007CED